MPSFLNRIFCLRGAIAIGLIVIGLFSGGFLVLAISSIGATLLLLADDRVGADAEPNIPPAPPSAPTSTDLQTEAHGPRIPEHLVAANVIGIHPDEPHRSSSDDTSPTLRVLVCEDDSLVRNLVIYILQSQGHTVTATEDARRALIAAAENPDFDTLLTDIRLPGMNGHDLATELRKERTDLPVVLMSGFAQVTACHPLLQTPGTVLLAKPFRPADLQRALMDANAGAHAHSAT